MGNEEDQKMVYETAETFQQEPYGEAVPYGDPNWYQGWASPYYKPTHHKFRVQVRKFVEEELMPNCNNFNHERFGFIAQATRFARVCLEEAFRYAFKRKTFGKRLVDHPVIRWKLAEMARQVESTH